MNTTNQCRTAYFVQGRQKYNAKPDMLTGNMEKIETTTQISIWFYEILRRESQKHCKGTEIFNMEPDNSDTGRLKLLKG